MALPKTPSFRLDGKTALITGASSGIGHAAAVALAEAGAHVTVAARRADALDQLVAELQVAGHSAHAQVMDVVNISETQQLVSDLGPFDVLLNSAGLARHSPAVDTNEPDFDAVSDLNVKGAYFLTQAVATGLIAAGRGGSLMNISSQMAHVGGIDRAVYCATKHAVEGFTKAMAIEFGKHDIRVNNDPEKRAWVERQIKLNRVGQVEDIMGAAVFLASDAAAMITGTSLLVDGGWTAE